MDPNTTATTADTAAAAAPVTTSAETAPAATSTDTPATAVPSTDASPATAAVQTGSDLLNQPAAIVAQSDNPDVKEFLSLVGDKSLSDVNTILKAGIDAQAAAAAPKEDKPLVDWAESLSVRPFAGQDVKGAQAALQAHSEANQPASRM